MEEGCPEGAASAPQAVTESVGDLEPISIAIQEEKPQVPVYESGSEEDCIRGALLGLAWGDVFGSALSFPFLNPPPDVKVDVLWRGGRQEESERYSAN